MFCRNVLSWRKKNNFDSIYPWRNSKDNYKILLSEILLKKTTRSQVAEQWDNFIKNFPNFQSLNTADLRKVRSVIKPLGLERVRSVQLKSLSKEILRSYNGKLPKSKKELLMLPGVGPYTANAILCFAFQHDVSMVDTNIMRVVKRVFSIVTNKTRERTDKKIWRFVEDLPPKGKGKVFNYAILDFASEVCTARNPKCPTCPMRKICDYYHDNFYYHAR